MSLARAWRRRPIGASSAALIVPSAMLAALPATGPAGVVSSGPAQTVQAAAAAAEGLLGSSGVPLP